VVHFFLIQVSYIQATRFLLFKNFEKTLSCLFEVLIFWGIYL